MAEREYKRLTYARRRPGIAVFTTVRSSLWLGKDHLLCIDTTGYTESYKRFYFRDIQAFNMRKTTRGLIWSIVLGALAAICVVIALIATTPGLDVTFWVIAAVFGMVLLLNLAYGTTAVCHLQTAVQTEHLPSLSRVRRARKVLNRIRPFIEASQGPLAFEEIPARMRELVAPAKSTDQPIS